MSTAVVILVAVVVPSLVAVFVSVTAPRILARNLQKQAAIDRQAAWDREDAKELVRKQAADEVARVQKETADKAARLLAENNQLVAHTSAGIADQLGTIHGLVNSNLTAEKQDRLDALRGQLVLVREVIDLKRAAGNEPSSDTLATEARIEGKIDALAQDISDRADAVQAAAAAAAAAAEGEKEAR